MASGTIPKMCHLENIAYEHAFFNLQRKNFLFPPFFRGDPDQCLFSNGLTNVYFFGHDISPDYSVIGTLLYQEARPWGNLGPGKKKPRRGGVREQRIMGNAGNALGGAREKRYSGTALPDNEVEKWIAAGFSKPEWEDATGQNGEEGVLRHQRSVGMRIAFGLAGMILLVGMGFYAMICDMLR